MQNLPLPAVLTELRDRGLIQDTTDIAALGAMPPGTPFYAGIDPTSPFLGIGNIIPLVVSLHLARAGLIPIILFGGATGAIGDPSGKQQERPLLSPEEIAHNVIRHQEKVTELFTRQGIEPQFVNNADWTAPLTLIDFLRNVGKFLTVNYMLAKESVRTRLDGEGLSFTEFSYMLLQANDYAHLYETHGCRLQIGGADQWGNITAGLELIRKKLGGSAHALSIPLLTNREGKKFGKSESGALYLNRTATTPFTLYQYFLNSADGEVGKLLRVLTFLPLNEIADIERESSQHPEQRLAQHRLAASIVALVHGDEAVEEARAGAGALFSGSEPLSDAEVEALLTDPAAAGVPRASIAGTKISSMTVADLFTETGLTPSKAEARRLAKNGGLAVNNQRITDPTVSVVPSGAKLPRALLLRVGKKSFCLVTCD